MGGLSDASLKSSSKAGSKVLVRLKSWFEIENHKCAPGILQCGRGKEKIRHVIPIAYLSPEDLQKLLDDSVAEFGHSYAGALQLASEEEELKEVLDTIHSFVLRG